MPKAAFERAEWLETDGLGGFASGTVAGLRTRRYHALLLVARRPPVDRLVLVNGIEAWLETEHGRFPLSTQRYLPDVIYPPLAANLSFFSADPWPTWTFSTDGGTTIEFDLLVAHGRPEVALRWRLSGAPPARARLTVRPLLSGREFHALHHENERFRFAAEQRGDRICWQPYPEVPRIVAQANGVYQHDPLWYRRFYYSEERARGLDASEDLAAPGEFAFDLLLGPAHLALSTDVDDATEDTRPAALRGELLRDAERTRRARFPTRLHRAAESYVVRRGRGRTVIAGYPWFSDWGRDSFIALRGIALATARPEIAADILDAWAEAVDGGMLPNHFPDLSERPEYNSVDAALWFVIAVSEFLAAADRHTAPPALRRRLQAAVEAVLDGYARGTRFGIHLDDDGLIACGDPSSNLTWMDARVDGVPITARAGKPVEVQALWLTALSIGASWNERWIAALVQGRASFETRFWNESLGALYDVVDVDGRAGAVDPRFRPNQLFAAGALAITPLSPEKARSVIDQVESRLWTPLGLRSLAADEPGYVGRYAGDARQRDAAYHQGTVWPWLLGPFVEAWVKTHGDSSETRRRARIVFLDPLLAHLEECGLGHLPEIADGDPPHTARGCPFQAWSVAEALRLSESVLAPIPAATSPRGSTSPKRRPRVRQG